MNNLSEWAQREGFLAGRRAGGDYGAGVERGIMGLAYELQKPEVIEAGAKAIDSLDWNQFHGGIDPTGQEIARACIAAMLAAVAEKGESSE